MKIRTNSVRLSVPKREAAFTYFVLEGYENISFYSTIEYADKSIRLIEVSYPYFFHQDMINLVNILQRKIVSLGVDWSNID